MFIPDDQELLMLIGKLLRIYGKAEVIDVLRNRADEISDGRLRLPEVKSEQG